MKLKKPLLVPVTLSIAYTDANTGIRKLKRTDNTTSTLNFDLFSIGVV